MDRNTVWEHSFVEGFLPGAQVLSTPTKRSTRATHESATLGDPAIAGEFDLFPEIDSDAESR